VYIRLVPSSCLQRRTVASILPYLESKSGASPLPIFGLLPSLAIRPFAHILYSFLLTSLPYTSLPPFPSVFLLPLLVAL